jgi:hypothetical protein
LSRTPASAGNRKTWTWAGWVKISSIGVQTEVLFHAGADNDNRLSLFFSTLNDGVLRLADRTSGNTTLFRTTTQVFRDFSAWYHIALVFDTTASAGDDRIKIYVNGLEVTQFTDKNNPSQNADSYVNNNIIHYIAYNGTNYFNGYLADIHFIDGQALDPTSFGEFDANGIWQPKAYTGSYGTNGFHLDFADNSSNTATTLGKDTSPNGNNWTPNNLSVTAGAGNDSLVDVPTNGAETDTGAGGEVRGNYCTWNPLDKASTVTLANGNLDASGTTLDELCRSTMYMPLSGKWYMEFVPDSNGLDGIIGVATASAGLGAYVGSSAQGWGFQPNISGSAFRYSNGGGSAISGTAFSANDVGMIAVDIDSSKMWLGRNGTWYESGNPATGANAQFTDLSTTSQLAFAVTPGRSGSGLIVANFGQRPFAYTAPSGFKALNTANLPAPVVTKPSDLFDVKLYTGNGSTQTISGLGFSPDLVWIKNRAAADNYKLTDIVRGATEELESNTDDAEVTNADGLTQFNADGFDLGDDDEYNTSSEAYVAWAWDAGSSTVTNTDGSISSQVRANASAGFSVVTYTGTGSAGATVGHGLGVTPGMIIIKSRNLSPTDWVVAHSSLNLASENLHLNDTSAAGSTGFGAIGSWSSTIFGFRVESGSGDVNGSGYDYVAYCFAPVAGYSSFGSYTGNGSADGPFVYTGFRPRWILVKNTVGTNNWQLFDSARNEYNVVNKYLQPNMSNDEATSDVLDIVSNGFKIRSTPGNWNGSTNLIVFAAFAEHPFQYARAR